MASAHSFSPIMDNGTGNESQSAEDEAVNRLRCLAVPDRDETKRQAYKSAQQGNRAEKVTERRVVWLVHMNYYAIQPSDKKIRQLGIGLALL